MEVQQTLGGRYKLLNELGSGGMAVVWKARDEVLGRSVAVKLLASRYAGDEQSRARILDEARAAAALSHPNVAQVYDFGESDEDGVCLPYVVMELINGPTLAQKVSEGPIPPRAIFRICSEVAAALAAAHALGLVHRDIKPANVMVTPARAKVVDFGIAAAAGPGRPDAELLGTPAYLAPERLLRNTVEPASDVYALGVLLYRLLTNESPWSVDTTTQMLDAHVYIEPNPMPQLPGVPVEVTDLITGCLRKDPGERPSAAEASTILADAADASMVQGVASVGRVERPPAPAAVPVDFPTGSVAAGQTGSVIGSPARGVAGGLAGGAAGGLAGGVAAGQAASHAGGAAADQAAGHSGSVAAGQAGGVAAAQAGSRPGNAAGVAAGVAGGAGGGLAGSAGAGAKALPGKAKNRRALAVGGVAVAVVAAVLLWIFLPGDAKTRPDDQAAVVPGASVQPSAAADAPSRPPAPGAGGENADVPGSVLVPGGGGPVGSAAPGATTGAPAPGQVTATPGPGTTDAPDPTTEPPATDPPATTKPTIVAKTLSSVGGDVVAECLGGQAELTSWDPAEDYKVDSVDAGPALASVIVFKKKASRIRMTVTCVAGIPAAVVLPL